jgi:hypothetical protein
MIAFQDSTRRRSVMQTLPGTPALFRQMDNFKESLKDIHALKCIISSYGRDASRHIDHVIVDEMSGAYEWAASQAGESTILHV